MINFEVAILRAEEQIAFESRSGLGVTALTSAISMGRNRCVHRGTGKIGGHNWPLKLVCSLCKNEFCRAIAMFSVILYLPI